MSALSVLSRGQFIPRLLSFTDTKTPGLIVRNPETAMVAQLRSVVIVGYVHCTDSMKTIYKGTDYLCECSRVFEIHDDGLLIIDGLTGQELPDGSIRVTPPHSERRQRRLLSLNDKGRMYQDALENGFKLTAESCGVPQGTLRTWGREYANLVTA